ncbi:hypothetical protein [Sedimenticola sp.]|uniref:hypothetical protein n=1 Tax=Sedimenticola sp. TaxID=1940285 RepID=UPI003D0EAF07
MLDSQTLGFADFRGSRQYVTTCNLEVNPRAFLFLMDYARSRRVEMWGTAGVVENDPALSNRLLVKSYPADVEQVILFTLKAWDVNCPRHIPAMVPMEEVSKICKRFETRIDELERENTALKKAE